MKRIIAVMTLLLLIAVSIYKEYLQTINVSLDIKDRVLLSYDSRRNFRQSINNCGPYNAAAVIRIVTGKDVDSENLVKERRWRIPRMGTHPWGVEKLLEQHGVTPITPRLGRLNQEQRFHILKQELSKHQPIILLGKTSKNLQHYITLLGYDTVSDEWYVYDSIEEKHEEMEGLTKDKNYSLPGNVTWPTQGLLDFWSGGGVFGFYKWYALIAES